MALQIDDAGLEVGIVTKRFEPMLKFYRDTLGLPLEREIDVPGVLHQIRLKCGANIIKFVVNAREPEAEAAPGGIAGATGYRFCTIPVRNIEDATASCEKGGYHIVLPVTTSAPGVLISIVEDPDGNWVELVQRS